MTTIIAPTGLNLFPLAGVYPVPQGTAGSVTTGTYHDLTTESTSLSSSWSDWTFDLRDGIGDPDPVIENLTPSICSIANFPLVERVISGTASIKVTWGSIHTVCTLDMKTVGGGSSLAVTGFQSGSVGAHAWDIVEPLLIAGGSADLFSGSAYNPACWAADFDFSGVALGAGAGTNITARHKLFVGHFRPAIGASLTDIAVDGTPHTRTVVAYNSGTGTGINGGNPNPLVGDIAVALMSADAGSGVAVYPVVGPWFYEEIGSDFIQAFVGFKLDQYRRVMLAGRNDTTPVRSELVSGTYNGVTVNDAFTWHNTDWGASLNLPAYLAAYSARYSQSIPGDSGCPRFVPLTGSTMALAGVVTGAGGGGQFPRQDILNACIASASDIGGYGVTLTVTVAPDLTS